MAQNLPENAAVGVGAEGVSLDIAKLDRLEKPAPLEELRTKLSAMLPRVDLPDLILEVHAKTGFRVLNAGSHTPKLAKAIAEVGGIAKSLFLLSYVDDEAHRRRVLVQLNRHEKRHDLARSIFHGDRGRVRKRYREGQEDQLSSLVLVLNVVALWNTIYLDEAASRLRRKAGRSAAGT